MAPKKQRQPVPSAKASRPDPVREQNDRIDRTPDGASNPQLPTVNTSQGPQANPQAPEAVMAMSSEGQQQTLQNQQYPDDAAMAQSELVPPAPWPHHPDHPLGACYDGNSPQHHSNQYPASQIRNHQARNAIATNQGAPHVNQGQAQPAPAQRSNVVMIQNNPGPAQQRKAYLIDLNPPPQGKPRLSQGHPITVLPQHFRPQQVGVASGGNAASNAQVGGRSSQQNSSRTPMNAQGPQQAGQRSVSAPVAQNAQMIQQGAAQPTPSGMAGVNRFASVPNYGQYANTGNAHGMAQGYSMMLPGRQPAQMPPQMRQSIVPAKRPASIDEVIERNPSTPNPNAQAGPPAKRIASDPQGSRMIQSGPSQSIPGNHPPPIDIAAAGTHQETAGQETSYLSPPQSPETRAEGSWSDLAGIRQQIEANLKWVVAPIRCDEREVVVIVKRLPDSGRYVADGWGWGLRDPDAPDAGSASGQPLAIAYTKAGRSTRLEALEDLLVQSEDMMLAADRLSHALANKPPAEESAPREEGARREEDARREEGPTGEEEAPQS